MSNNDVTTPPCSEPIETPQPKKSISYPKLIGNIAFGIFAVFMCIVTISLIQSKRSGEAPKFLGYQTYIVLSGSMNPEFNTGAMVFVKPTDSSALQAGDIITFRGDSGDSGDLTTTHRIIEVLLDGSFVTKGDANSVNDPNPISGEQVVGRVTLAVPYIGYVMDFARTKNGLFVLVIIPGALIIASELRKLYRYAAEHDRQQEAKKKAQQEAEHASTS